MPAVEIAAFFLASFSDAKVLTNLGELPLHPAYFDIFTINAADRGQTL